MLALHLPAFRLERCGYDPRDAVVLIEFAKSADRVVACTLPAAKAGILPGMVLAGARALLPQLRVERRQAGGEQGDLFALRDSLLRFSPAIAAVLPDGLLVDVPSTQLAAVRDWVGKLGHGVQAAWAPSAWAAMVVARHLGGNRILADSAEIAATLGPLPVAALGVEGDVLDSLADAGIRTVGQFAALPVASLSGRYGAQVRELHIIARGGGAQSAAGQGLGGRASAGLAKVGGRQSGKQKGQLEATSAALRDDPVWSCELDDSVDLIEAVLFVLHGLCRDCESDLTRAGTAACRVQIRLRLEQGEHLVPVRLGQPVRGADRLFRQLRVRLERVQLGAPCTAVSLELLESAPWSPPQPGLFDARDAVESLPEVLARLQDALGSEAVFRPALADAWRPEAGWVPVFPGQSEPRPVAAKKPDAAQAHEPDADRWSAPYQAGKIPSDLPLPPGRGRPTTVLPAPRPVRVATGPSGRPRALLLDRETVPITELWGPERLSGEWWKDATAFCRDYWCATLGDGRRAWIFAESSGYAQGEAAGDALGRTSTLGQRWCLHGWLDGGGPESTADAGPVPEPQLPANVLAFPQGGAGARVPDRPLPTTGPAGVPASGVVPLPPAAHSRPPAANSRPRDPRTSRLQPGTPSTYAALGCRSNYSFSEGASFPEELLDRAESLGLAALALTDRDGSYGAVRAHREAKKRTIPLIHGALLAVRCPDAPAGRASVVALVQNLQGWGSLCRLLSAERFPIAGGLDSFAIGIPADPRTVTVLDPDPARDAARRHTGKGWPELPLDTLLADQAGLILIARGGWTERGLATLRDAAGDRLYRGISRRLDPGELERIDASVKGDLPCVALADALMHDAERQSLQDALTCIRLGLTLDQAGRRLQPNAERALLAPDAMARRFSRWPELLHRTLEIAGRCNFSLSELKYSYPREVTPSGYSPQAWLRELVRRGLILRYGGEIPEKVAKQVEYELGVIHRLEFPAYFLTVHDLVRFARSRGILCQGRGSAANSAVCYALGITSVDPAHSSLLFERFISEERREPPDIDVDFEHERREEVIQYCYEKYGRNRAAMVNEVICYRGRSAVRDVGKAVGLGLDQVERLCGLLDSWGRLTEGEEVLVEAGLDPKDARVQLAMRLARQIQGFPRHTSIHVGGFVISDGPLVDRVPIEPASMAGRTVIQWDKDDVDELCFVKVDLLALGMLSAIRKCFDLMRAHHGTNHDLATVPREDKAVYEMLGEADSIGVFQVESRAQQGMLPRLKPQCFYDIVIEVSVVRPGPIQGGMVHPYLRRRQGLEPVEYADERLIPILARTLGVPIFQEQVMAMAVAVGGFTPGEADQLRRAMGAWRKRGGLSEITDRLMSGLLSNGLSPEYAERVCKQIQGFAEYGFPESHAASFAHLVYVSAWQRCFYPAAFTASLINSQPMGFYAPRTLIADIERHGVEVRPVDVLRSEWDCTLEPGRDGVAIRLGLRLVKGLGEVEGRGLARLRSERTFTSLPDLATRSGLARGALRNLARANALAGLLAAVGTAAGVAHSAAPPGASKPAGRVRDQAPPGRTDRRSASFEVDGLWPGMFAAVPRESDTLLLPVATPAEEMQADYSSVGLTPGTHPLALVRDDLRRKKVVSLARLIELPDNSAVTIAGLVGVRQRPDTASGVIFLMLEDETGTANVVIWPSLYKRQRTVIRTERLLIIRGTLQRMDGAISVVARHCRPLSIGAEMQAKSRDFH